MFAPGSDQADGLKRWFQPPLVARLDLISVGADLTLSFSADRIAQSLDALGLGVHWDDPLGLLTATGTLPPDATGTDLHIAVNNELPTEKPLSSRCLGRLFVAPAEPAVLPRLYGLIKSSIESAPDEPITVMWSSLTPSDESQSLCAGNLSRTAQRFLGLELQFLNSAVATGARQARALMEPMVASIMQPSFERRETAPVLHN